MTFTLDQQYAAQEIHGIILGILWGILSDFLLIFVRYFKHWQKYLIAHSLFTLMNLISIPAILIVIIYDSSYLFNKQGFDAMPGLAVKIHYILGMVFLFTIVGIQILGMMVKYELQSINQLPQVTLKKKKVHRALGYSFYIIAKAQVCLGCWVYNFAWNWRVTLSLCWYFAAFLLIVFFLERRHRKQDMALYISKKQQSFNEQHNQLNHYQGLLEMLNNGMSKQKIQQQFPNIKYVMYKTRVYDVTNLEHPGGKTIIEQVVGEEISRYIHGAYSLQTSKLAAHAHSAYAQQLLNQFYIGQVNLNNCQFLVPQIGDKTNIPTIWSLTKSTKLSKNLKCFYFETTRFKIRSNPGIQYLCRHFLLKSLKRNLQPRLYTLTLSMSLAHRTYVNQIFCYLKDQNYIINYSIQKNIAQLPFVIKQYKVGGFSQYLHTISEGEQLLIEGPYGRGLELEPDGVYYAFCGGTGVLPLLDLIYEILLQLYSFVNKSTIKRLPVNFKLVLYLSVNTVTELAGLEIITDTYLMCRKFNFDIFNLFLRVSKGEQIIEVPKFSNRLDENFLRQVFKDVKNVKAAIVCGSPVMNYETFHNLSKIMQKSKIHIL